MQARYYDPVVGRFMAVDPVGFSAGNPMTFNRYSYANNNPYYYIDPNGETVAVAAACAGPQAAACVGAVVVASAITWYVSSTDSGKALVDSIGQLMNKEGEDSATPEPGTAESDEGCIYCVSGEKTASGKDYVGAADDMGKREQDSSDGRDRKGAEKVDRYKKGDRTDRQDKEQQAMNDRGGKEHLDNERNEVAPSRWEERGIQPPNE